MSDADRFVETPDTIATAASDLTLELLRYGCAEDVEASSIMGAGVYCASSKPYDKVALQTLLLGWRVPILMCLTLNVEWSFGGPCT